jgi:glycosyltransferase involved in cell wall biosynthesis
MNNRSVCMVAYANYYTDARIKNYVGALIKRGYDIDVYALGSTVGEPQTGVRIFSVMQKYWGNNIVHYAFSQLWFALLVTLLVSWRFYKRKYCIIHVHNIPNFLVFTALIPRLGGAKVILDIHDTMPEAYATKFELPLDHPLVGLFRLEERLSAWFAHQVITTNELHKEVLCSHGIPKNKIEVILNVGNERLFHPFKHGEQHDGLTLVYHGTIAERLGIDLILKGMDLAIRECPSLRLLLIGEGDFLPTVKTLVKELELTDKVQITGFIPVEELPIYLAKGDVGVVGNRKYTEEKQNYMLPVKMLEYAAMEIPTIAPRLRIISHYFDEGSAIFYTPDDPEDMARKIVEVCRNRKVLDNVKDRLRAFNQVYNWPIMERKYLDLVVHLTS